MENDIKNSEDFLRGITSKSKGFTTPDGYMDSVFQDIESKLTTDTFPKETGFATPKGYIENFEFQPQKKAKVLRLLPYISVAAAVIFGIFIFNQPETKTKVDFAALDSEGIYDYLELNDINNGDIALRMSLSAIEEIDNSSETSYDDYLYEYLENNINNIDILDL